MELSVRDWMIVIGVLLIAAVLLDGYRRMRNERRGNIRVSLNKQFLNTGGADVEQTSELPNGGARVKNYEADEIALDSTEGPELGDVQLDLQPTVPMLMESVDLGEAADVPIDELVETAASQPDVSIGEVSPESSTAKQTSPSSSPSNSDIDEEVVVINLVAKDEPFKGPDLLHILLACDLRFGEMDIFHRHEKSNGSGSVQFSMANSVEPGIFNLDKIDNFTTPGVCFFMSVPGPEQAIKAFDCMVETAQCLASNLNGEMLDESRSAMTRQTLEHCRQRIKEFERRQLTQHT